MKRFIEELGIAVMLLIGLWHSETVFQFIVVCFLAGIADQGRRNVNSSE
jgi:hypothetical protein